MSSTDSDSGDEPPTMNTLNKKLDSILCKLSGMETQFSELRGTVSEQQKSIKKIEDQVADNIEKLFLLEDRMNQITPTQAVIDKLNDRVEDLANRLRRNNIIFHNIPEESEGRDNYDCSTFVKDFLVNHMKMEDAGNYEIERAHRSPTGPRRDGRIRPIHVKLLRYPDRVAILKQASSLKDNPYHGNNIFISDDVSVAVRKQRKQLVRVKKLLQQKHPGKRVFIPHVVPAVLLREDSNGELVRVRPGEFVDIDDGSDEHAMELK